MSTTWGTWDTWLVPANWGDEGQPEVISVYLTSVIKGCDFAVVGGPTFRQPRTKTTYTATELVIQR